MATTPKPHWPNNHYHGSRFASIRNQIIRDMQYKSHVVHPIHWQGMDVSNRPEMRSHELLNVTFTVPLQGVENLNHWRHDIKPNLPWADDHFEERVCGFPINPGVEWANWPWGKSADTFRDQGQFNHNYMERYWPKYAAMKSTPSRTADEWVGAPLDREFDLNDGPHYGLRNPYGDLNDLVGQLVKDPHSRQEWFPIFHPEDVGEVVGGRKPCTLGYQFIRRDDQLHVYYPLRSCDLIRHWPDDCYLTVRLLIWVIEQCRHLDSSNWDHVRPGSYSMHCTSLHVFENDIVQIGGKR